IHSTVYGRLTLVRLNSNANSGSGGGRGVNEKNKVVAAKDFASPSMIDEPVVKEKHSSLVDISIPNVEKTDLRSYPPLPTQGSTPAGLGVAKNLKKPSQAYRGVPVGLKVGFKPVKQAFRPVYTKPTANTSGNKKNDVEPTKNKEPDSSGSSFWNVESSSTSTTPIVDKIRKFEKLIIDRKVTLVDDEGEPVKKVDYLADHDSVDAIASVDNDWHALWAFRDCWL
ncbi:hypothetical protein Tco_1487554, partial [Tanacetum coccineum]